MLKDDKINYLNIGLMFATAVFAFFAPFETFLLAYAFLGPLHYLTEISWLHDRQYFTKGKYDFIVLLVIGVLLSTVAFAQDFGYKWEIYTYFSEMQLSSKLVVFALFSGMLFALVKNIFVKIVSCFFIFIFVSGWLSPENIEENQSSTTVFALTSLVPTLIHVYVFTGLFMLYGSLKSRSKSGLMAVVAVVILPLILVFVLPVNPKESWVSNYGKNAYYAKGQGFFNTNVEIMDHFGILEEPKLTNKQFLDSIVNSKTVNAGFTPNEKKRLNDSLQRKSKEPFVFYQPNDERFGQTIAVRKALPVNPKDYFWSSVFFSTFGIMLMRFIAFAYLYHYLNWFSKTEVIRWHKVPKIRFFAVIVLWLSACGFYIYDYSLGLSVLFFLSFTHVLLEFPLNMVSIVGIGKEVRSIYRNGFKPLNSDT